MIGAAILAFLGLGVACISAYLEVKNDGGTGLAVVALMLIIGSCSQASQF